MRKNWRFFCQKFIFGEQLLIFSIVLTPADLTDRDWSLIWSTPGDPPPMSLNGKECYINVKLSKVAARAGSWFLQSHHSSHLQCRFYISIDPISHLKTWLCPCFSSWSWSWSWSSSWSSSSSKVVAARRSWLPVSSSVRCPSAFYNQVICNSVSPSNPV